MIYTDYDGATRDSDDPSCFSGLYQADGGYVHCQPEAGHQGQHWGICHVHDLYCIVYWDGGGTCAGDPLPIRNIRHEAGLSSLQQAILSKNAQ